MALAVFQFSSKFYVDRMASFPAALCREFPFCNTEQESFFGVVKTQTQGLCVVRYLIHDQRKTGEHTGLLLNGAGDLVTDDMEKADVLCAPSSVFTGILFSSIVYSVFQPGCSNRCQIQQDPLRQIRLFQVWTSIAGDDYILY